MATPINARAILAAALSGAGSSGQSPLATGTPSGALPSPSPAPAAPPGPVPGQTAGPGPAGAGGAPSPGGTASMSNADLSAVMGSGQELGQDPDAMTQMIQLLQDPGTPPDQKAAIQSRLQLAALKSIAGGPGGPSS
jgi:hypothetical protein